MKVILKPTKKFPEGYFYTDDNEITRELIENYSWFLDKKEKRLYVKAHCLNENISYFHIEYAYKVLDYYPSYVDHISGVAIDNRDSNLNVVTNQFNSRNKPTRGYSLRNNRFRVRYLFSNQEISAGSYKNEVDALVTIFSMHKQYYSDYNYNFLLDRRDDSDIVDLELTGQITKEQATELHVRRYVENNPWYVYRYGLEDYCKEHDILVPDFDIDSQGFMINPVTRQRLCPY